MIRKIKQNKLLFRLLIIVIVFIIIGIFFLAVTSKDNKLLIKDNLNIYFKSLNNLNYFKGFGNSIINNYFYLLIIWILGISIIGIPIAIVMLILKSFILGYTISSIIYFYGLKGVFISIIYIIPLVINLIIIYILCYFAINFSKNLNKMLFLKKNISLRFLIKNYLRVLLYSGILFLISSLIEIFLIPNILRLLQI